MGLYRGYSIVFWGYNIGVILRYIGVILGLLYRPCLVAPEMNQVITLDT